MPIYETQYGQGLGQDAAQQGLNMLAASVGSAFNPQWRADRKASQYELLRNQEALRNALPQASFDPNSGEAVHTALIRDMARKWLGLSPLAEARYGELTTHPRFPNEFVYSDMPGAAETQKSWLERSGGSPGHVMGTEPLSQDMINMLAQHALFSGPGPERSRTIEQALREQRGQSPYISNPLAGLSYETGGKVGSKGSKPTAKESGSSAIEQLKQLLNLDRDEVPAVLHKGEYVINKDSAEAIGRDLLNELNSIQSYDDGGIVGQSKQDLQQMSRRNRSPSAQQQGRLGTKQGVPQSQFPDPAAVQNVQEANDLANAAESMGYGDLANNYRVQAQILSGNVPTGAMSPQPSQEMNMLDALMAAAQRESGQGMVDLPSNIQPTQETPLWNNFLRNMQQAFSEETRNKVEQERIRQGMEGDRFHGYGGMGRWWSGKQDEGFVGGSTPGLPPSNSQGESEEGVVQEEQETEEEEKEAQRGKTETTASTVNNQQTPPPLGFRPAGSAMPIDWNQISQMEPARAAQYLQRVAQTQGQFSNIPQLEQANQQVMPASQRLFGQLMNQYQGVQKAEQGDIQKNAMQLELEKLAAESPYFNDLARANLDLKNAKIANLLAQASYAAEKNRSNVMTMMDPTEALRAMKNGMDLRQETIKNIRTQIESLKGIQEENNKPETRRALAKAQLKLAFATNAISLDASTEEIRKMVNESKTGPLSFIGIGRDLLNDDAIEEVKLDYMNNTAPALKQYEFAEDYFGLLTGRPSPSQAQSGASGSNPFFEQYKEMMDRFAGNK